MVLGAPVAAGEEPLSAMVIAQSWMPILLGGDIVTVTVLEFTPVMLPVMLPGLPTLLTLHQSRLVEALQFKVVPETVLETAKVSLAGLTTPEPETPLNDMVVLFTAMLGWGGEVTTTVVLAV